MELLEKTLERNGTNIHFWLGGMPSRPLVVFTHGALIDHHEWDADLEVVAEHFQVLAWDVPGHGLSRPAVFSLAAAEADLLAILDSLKVSQAVFVGHSMGGNLHQELVFHHPERVKAMVFLDCTWNFQKLTRMEKFMLNLAEPIFKLYPYKSLVDQSLASIAFSRAAQDSLRPAVESLTKEQFIQIMMATASCLHYEPGYVINKPLLLMVGENDINGNIRKIMPVWANAEPDCRLETIPLARHAANLDNPAFFQQTLMDFLLKRCI
jgi:3-oxoadipate enol-lactonase